MKRLAKEDGGAIGANGGRGTEKQGGRYVTTWGGVIERPVMQRVMEEGGGRFVIEKSAGKCRGKSRMNVTGRLSALQEMGTWCKAVEGRASAVM
jgi:hypothetical protein